jgi:HSP20 family protein
MFGNLTGFGSLLDELRRLDAGWDDSFTASPWVSGLRSTGWGAYPPINIGSNPESVDVYLFAAGLDPQNLNVSVQQNLLTVSGERKHEPEAKAQYYRRERFTGAFQRTVTLPDDVDPDKVEAHYRDGVLHVRVGRREEVRPRRIQIH